MARRAEVPLRSRVVRDEPLRALSIACAETGPWNVVALAEPFAGNNCGLLKQLLVEVSGATGLVMVGPQARRVTGPAIIAVEDVDAPAGHAADGRAADRPRRRPDRSAADRPRRGAPRPMDGQARLVVEAREDVRIEMAEVARGEAAVIAEALRRLSGGFVICQFGGLVVPDEGDLQAAGLGARVSAVPRAVDRVSRFQAAADFSHQNRYMFSNRNGFSSSNAAQFSSVPGQVSSG